MYRAVNKTIGMSPNTETVIKVRMCCMHVCEATISVIRGGHQLQVPHGCRGKRRCGICVIHLLPVSLFAGNCLEASLGELTSSRNAMLLEIVRLGTLQHQVHGSLSEGMKVDWAKCEDWVKHMNYVEVPF